MEENKLRAEFWVLWAQIREQIVAGSARDLQAAQHAAWVTFKTLKQQTQNDTKQTN